MSAVGDRTDLEQFRDIVARRFGLRFDDARLGQLAEALEIQLARTREPVSAYLGRVGSAGLEAADARALTSALTVPETYFFRNVEQFHAFSEVALPARMSVRSNTRGLRLLSAGCALGDEAYSMAIVIRDLAGLAGWDVSIRGVDLSGAAISKADEARYSAWSLRATPADIQRRFFRAAGRDYVLDPGVRAMVTFQECNLVDAGALWQPETFDVVFCRNVLMYLTPEAAQGVVAHISRSLAPGGFLFLGHAETLRGLSRDFHLRHTHETFYYQRRAAGEGGAIDDGEPGRGSTSVKRVEPDPAIGTDDSWVENIRRASERVQSLTRGLSPGGARSAVEGATSTERARADLVVAVDHLRGERYAEAQATLDGLPQDAGRDPDTQLLRAVLLTHGGDLARAEQICRDLLEQDDMSAGAHYLMALCREGAGDAREAVDHDHRAAYLDPAFAMPRLHLGLLARRARDWPTARQELQHALALLQHEDASRVLLFGGGFNRDALVALCRAEIARCGEAR